MIEELYEFREEPRNISGHAFFAAAVIKNKPLHDSMKITVLGVEIRIGRVIEFEDGGEQSKMAGDELVAMDLSR